MASSSTPSSSITTLTKKYEVFLSFRGEDTRHGFTSHLYDALCRKQIETFIDDDKLERGDEISPALLRAIQRSKIAAVIFSENYASSKWCLRELEEIIKCKKLHEIIVMPVFYNVDPSNVRKQTGSFECNFANYEEKESPEEVQKWREALTEASNLSGWDSSVIRTESKLVGDIVEDVWRKLMNEHILASSDFEGLVGIHERIERVMSLLCLDMEDVRIIGIWGMGGIGKTTIARAVFNFISNKFDGACFIEKVGKRLLENDGSSRLQLEVLSKVLHKENPKLDTPIRPFIMEMFNQKKVFIVLDDVNNFLQSETLVDCLRRCGLGSRIIITSRDKQVLCNFKVDDHEIYEEKGLDGDEDLELFRQYANPTEDCMALSYRIVEYAKGNPLAIKVLGSSLKGKSKREWESALNNLRGIVNPEIFDVFKISYDGLNEEEKKLFLDLACFDDLYDVRKYMFKTELLDCDYFLSVLSAKSLVTIYKGKSGNIVKMQMHDLLQDMGREIVCRESPKNPGKRSRLWEQDDVIRILKNNTGTDAVEGISLFIDDLEEDIHLSPQVFDEMYNLRFLFFDTCDAIHLSPQVFNDMYDPRYFYMHPHKDIHDFHVSTKVHLPNGLNCLPDELRILIWPIYPLRVLPSNFNPKELVKLDLSGSKIEQLWDVAKSAPKLKWLILDGCKHLTRIPNLSDFPLLEELDLSKCESLVDFPSSVQQHNHLRNLTLRYTAIEEVPSSIQSLTNLNRLCLFKCKRLKHISTSICKLKSLSSLLLTECYKLEIFPEILETMESLKSLCFSSYFKTNMDFKALPLSIELLNRLQSLTLFNFNNLEMLPSSICNLTSLKYLCLAHCSKLVKLPDNFGNLKSLEWLDCSRCSLMEIPEGIGYLSSLKKLELRGNMFESLPKSIKQLSKLTILSLTYCKMLRSIPEFPEGLEWLDAMDCDQLCQVPDASEFVRCINSKSHVSPTIFREQYHMWPRVNFRFIKSLNLIKAVSNVFKELLRIMQHTEKGSGLPLNQFSICLSGDQILEWFSYQSLGSYVNIQVLRNDLVNRKFMGFAICAIFGFDKNNSTFDRLAFDVGCEFETYYDHIKIGFLHKYRYPFQVSAPPSKSIVSDNMLLGYCPFYPKNLMELPAGDSDYVVISIRFTIPSDNKLKRCAVHPIYAEEPIEIIGATIQEIGETSGRRSDRSDDNDEEVEPHPKRICTHAIKTP